MLENFNYGGTTTLRNSVNKEATSKLTKISHLVGLKDIPPLKAGINNDISPKAAAMNLSLQKLRTIDKAVIVRKP